ncbi:MAG: hypothetical protein K2Y14_13875 [Burkholderiales bacterium]|nr:hypothetical protein [Burkholderiales bacterium]
MMGDKVRTGNIEDETECSVKYIKYLDNRLRPMLGRAPTAAEIRTAYHLGDGGFQKMVNAGSNAKIEEVLPSIIPTNQHLKNQTLASYMQKQDAEFNKHQSQYLSDHPTPFVTYEQRAKILTKAQTVQNQLNEQEKVTLEQLEKNHIAMAANGEMGFEPISFAQLSKVYPKNPEVAKQKYDAYVSAIKVGNQINYMQSMDPSTRAAMISQAAPDPKNPGTYASDAAHQESLIKANEAINKAYQEDPATQALKDPTVRQLSATGGQALQTAMIANQKRMGVINPHLLTKQQEESTIQKLNDTQGLDTAKELQAMQAKYGDNFPLVARQLQQNKSLSQGVVAIIGAPTALAAQQASLIRGIPLDTLKDALPSNVKSQDIDDAIKKSLESYRASLPDNQLDSATYGDITKSIEKTAYSKARFANPDIAAKYAVDMFVGADKYKYADGADGHTLRVPKKFDEHQIAYSAKAVVNKLDKNNIDFNGVPLQKNSWYMTDDAEGYLNQIKEKSYWQTNQDDSGASLFFTGSDGRAYPVKDKSGQLITKSFDELSVLAAPPKPSEHITSPYSFLKVENND